eukprot:367090-Amphidinium_carterae.3
MQTVANTGMWSGMRSWMGCGLACCSVLQFMQCLVQGKLGSEAAWRLGCPRCDSCGCKTRTSGTSLGRPLSTLVLIMQPFLGI